MQLWKKLTESVCTPFFVELISFVIQLVWWQTKSLFCINAQIRFILWFATAEYIFKTNRYLKNCFWPVVGQKSWLQNTPIPECRAPGTIIFSSALDSCSALKPRLDALLSYSLLPCAYWCFIPFKHFALSFVGWVHHWNHNRDWNSRDYKIFGDPVLAF